MLIAAKPDAERDADEELPLAGELEAPRRAACAPPARRERGRERRRGAGGGRGMAIRAPLERNGDARDDLAQRGLGLVARGDEAVGVGGEADAVREDGDGEVVDVVGDAVVAAAQERPRARGVAERDRAARRGAEGEQRRGARRDG